jgi:hypothetical protein
MRDNRGTNRNSTFGPAMAGEKNWSRYNVLLCGIIFLLVLVLDILIINHLVRFVNETFTRDRSGSAQIIVSYITIFILALLFQLIMAFDADRRKNTMQVVAIAIFNVLCAGISVVQIVQVDRLKACTITFTEITQSSQTEQLKLEGYFRLAETCFYSIARESADGKRLELTPGDKTLAQIANDIASRIFVFQEIYHYQLTVAVSMFVGAIVGFYFAYKSYIQHGWSVFLVQGADLNKKKILERYQLFMLFLKLNAYCFLGVMAQYFVASFYFRKDYNSATSGQTELIVTAVIVIITTAVYTAFGYYGARKSSYLIMGIFLILLMINFLGLIVILYRVFISDRDEYRPTIIWLTSFGNFN